MDEPVNGRLTVAALDALRLRRSLAWVKATKKKPRTTTGLAHPHRKPRS
jgi:hypothetical protein